MLHKNNIYKESQKSIPIRGSYDVIVCGGGPAGIAAAISSARAGAKTLLLEFSGVLGGVSTSGLMSHWTGDTEGALYEEILANSYTGGPNYYFDDENRRYEYKNKFIIDTEKLKHTYIKMIEEAQIDLLLYTYISEPIIKGYKVEGVIIESKSGREAILSKVTIDATGDGDIAAKAGVPYQIGRGDNRMQPMTLMFKVGGVNYDTAYFALFFEDNYKLPNGQMLQDLAKEKLDDPMGHVLLYPNQIPGVVTVNMTNCTNVDGTKVEDLTKATITCQKQIPIIIDFLKKNIPGYEQCYLYQTATHIGVRETRHFKGLYTITEGDIAEARQFEDWIATRCFFNFDIHNLDGHGLDPHGQQDNFTQQNKYTIPYRSTIPENIDGLLLTGRNISGTHVAHSNFRVMPICVNIGQGTGVAAALSAQTGVKLRDLSIQEIQDILIKQGVHAPKI